MRSDIRVLYIDSEEAFAERVEPLLERRRFAVETTRSAETVLSVLDDPSERVDCIISGYRMPGMDGLELLEAVRERDSTVPFVLFTGTGNERVASRAIAAGVSDYVLKRDDAKQLTVLANRIDGLVRGYRSERDLEAERDFLRDFYDISTDGSRSLDEKLDALLEVGCMRFSFDIGILSHIVDSTYTVRSVYAPAADIEAGDQFDLEATYCEEVVAGDRPMSFTDATKAGKESHPAYREFGLESYLGVPVFVDGVRYGTLNFSSPTTRATPISEAELTLVRVIAQWIGNELERVRSQRRLERDNDLLDRSQRLGNVGGWELDLRTEELRWTDETARIHGLPPGYEPELETAIEFYHPDDRDVITAAVDRAISERESYDHELRLVRADGEQVWVRAIGEPTVEDGETVMLNGVFQDITERKRREQAIADREQRLSKVMEASDDAISIKDPEGRYLLINDAGAAYFDEPAAAIVGRTNADLLHSGTAQALSDSERAVLETGETRRDVEALTIDGTEYVFESIRAPYRASDGECIGVVCVARDFTERERLERRLRALQDTARELNHAETVESVGRIAIEAADEVLDMRATGLWRFDADERLLVPVTQTPEADGHTEQARVGPDTGDGRVWNAFDRGEFVVSGEEAGEREGSPLRAELVVPLGDWGVIRTETVETQSISDVERDLFLALAATVEAALVRAERLESLRAHEAELARRNERLDEFAGIVSHDLRNPLTIATWRLELAAEDCPSPHHESLQGALDRMDALIDDVLALARQGRVVNDPEPIDLAELAELAWETVDTAGVELTLEEPGIANGDPERVRTLFENLFRNAVEHGAPETIRVGALGDEAGFYVEDDGAGLPPEKTGDVFEYGFSTNVDGTGFGLAIVENVAESHGWEVDATNGPSGGARFELTIGPSPPRHRSRDPGTGDHGRVVRYIDD